MNEARHPLIATYIVPHISAAASGPAYFVLRRTLGTLSVLSEGCGAPALVRNSDRGIVFARAPAPRLADAAAEQARRPKPAAPAALRSVPRPTTPYCPAPSPAISSLSSSTQEELATGPKHLGENRMITKTTGNCHLAVHPPLQNGRSI